MYSTSNIENLAKYKAIALVGRVAIDKLMNNGLIIINANDLEKMQADLHALNAQVEIRNAEGTQKYNG